MYKILINSNKTINLSKEQFILIKLIGQLGFVNYNQLTLLWCVANKTYVSFSYSTLRRWINNYHLLRKRPVTPSKIKRSSNLSRPVYYLAPISIKMLKHYNVDYIPLSQLNYNSHNEQCNEVTVQSLYRAAFDVDLINNLHQQPIDRKTKHLMASSNFSLDKLDLRQFSKQIPDFKKYPFRPDQMISFVRNGKRYEAMVELDNRSENDNVQMHKIFDYLTYAYDNPSKKILMTIAITDGALANYRVQKYRPIYKKINNLLVKFKDYPVYYKHEKYSLASIYRMVKNITITISGVGEAHVDIADFIVNKNCTNFSTITLKALAHTLTDHFKQKVTFQTNKKINTKHLDYLDIQGQTLGYMVYDQNFAVYQTVKIGYEHSLDTYLDLYNDIPQNVIYSFPTRTRKLLTPSIPTYYKNNPGQSMFIQKQGMVYQPVLEDNINPQWLLQLLYAKLHYYNYLYKFFLVGRISASDSTNYRKLTYLHSKAYPLFNSYLKRFNVKVKNVPSMPYKSLHTLAVQADSPRKFAEHLNIQDIPVEVVQSIFHQIPIRSFSFPYLSTSSLHPAFTPQKYLYLPDKINPSQRTKISF